MGNRVSGHYVSDTYVASHLMESSDCIMESSDCIMESLPDAMLYQIFLHVPLRDLKRGVMLVNKRWYYIAQDCIRDIYKKKVKEAWEIVVGPLNHGSPKQAIKDYFKAHPYVRFTGLFKRQGDYLLILVESRGIINVEIGPIWGQFDALQKGPQYISLHPGVLWTGHWNTTIPGQMSVLNVHCVGKPDNGLATVSLEYSINIYNKSSFLLHVLLNNEGVPQISHPQENPCLKIRTDLVRGERYVKLRLKLLDNELQVRKCAWFYTWKNYSWIVSDENICRQKEGADLQTPEECTEKELENDILAVTNDYKWLYCNVIKSYRWNDYQPGG